MSNSEVFKQLVQGTEHKAKEIEIDTPYGTLEGNLTPLSRTVRWKYIEAIPQGFIDAGQAVSQEEIEEGSVEAEEVARKYRTIPDETMMASFIEMIKNNFVVDGVSPTQMEEMITKAFTDQLILELGFEILNVSADVGDVEGFREKE